MSKKNIDHSVESRVCFEQLEEWVREQIQFYVQELLENEVTELLGRRKNERRREVDAPGGYRNGYGKERRVTLSCGTIKLGRPRVRDLEERFESRVLPLFAKRTREVRDLIPELYLHGLADGHLGIWGALCNVFPEAEEQRCWNHRIVNVLAKISKSHYKPALLMLRQIPYAETRQEAKRLKGRFQHWCHKKGLEAAAALIDQDWDRMVTFYNYPKQQWQHLRTTNPVESPFSALRLRTDAARRFKKVANARAVIWKMLLVAEKRFRRLKAPHLMKEVYQGVHYVNGVPVNQVTEEKAA